MCTPFNSFFPVNLIVSLFSERKNKFVRLRHPGAINHIYYKEANDDPILCISPAHNELCVNREFINKVKQGIELINNNDKKGIMKEDFPEFSFDSFSFYLPKAFQNAE